MENILEKIYKSSLKLLLPSTLEKVYSIVVDEAIKLVDADSGAIYLVQNGEFKAVYSSLTALYSIKPRKRANTYKAFTSQKPIIADISGLERAHSVLRNMGLKAAIFIPLSYQNKAIGVLTVNTKHKNKFDEDTTRILTLFGSMVSLAIRKAQLYDETSRALETRDLFISMAAHELRTPLTAVNGYIQLLRNKLRGVDSAEARWMEQLYWESIRLANLVNELLEINRIRTGHLQYFLKECSLKEILERVYINFRFSYPNRELVLENKLDGNGKDIVIGDYDKILQVFTNLLDNAVKFSPESSSITLLVKRNKDNFVIQVKDQGMGIPKKDLPQIFDGFQQGHGHSKEGLGLGLFLVKDIINRHHGDINVRSRQGKGTTVEVKLPEANL